ncbi:hypothetical protein IAU60_001027 [Kwoniella sp. DSM 27419]
MDESEIDRSFEPIEDTIIVTRPPPQPLPSTPSRPRSKSNVTQTTSPLTSPIVSTAGPSTRRSLRSRNSDVKMDVGGVDGDSRADAPAPQQEEKRYIQPDHFYPLTNHAGHPTNLRGVPQPGPGVYLSPEDDRQALRGIPVFKPTMEEFADFEGYAKATTEWGQYSGIVKIIPPAEWSSNVPPITKSSISSLRVRTPIQQNFLGTSGLFRIANVVKNKSRPLTIEEWFKKCKDKKFAGLGPKDVGRTLNRDSKEAFERRERVKAEIQRAKEEKRDKRRKAEERRASRLAQSEKGEEDAVNGDVDVDPEVPPLDPSGESPHSSPDPHPTTPDSEDIEPWYRTFNPSEDWLPPDTKPDDYTVEACAALERQFWKNQGIGEPSWYGADMEGSLFVDEKTPWNVARLPNLLNRWDLDSLPGVNTPYLYFGMWGATFAWHVEDMDLFSINYIHFGAPKYWYAVPQLQAEKFERVLQGYFAEESRKCDQFLRHKAYAVSPHRLANDGINVNMLVHNQGEFVITYPRGYHAGFNMGFNCAESVNFALDSWVELGRRAKACTCVSHSVRIDVDEMLAKEERRMRGEEDLLQAIEEERKAQRPRKRLAEHSDGQSKRAYKEPVIKGEDVDLEHDVDATEQLPVARNRKHKQPINLSPSRPTAIVKENPTYPCLFCPGLGKEGLLPVRDPPENVKNQWKPRTGEIKAHHSCALALPNVGIEDIEVNGRTRTFIMGVDNIESARWNLKCAVCQDKRLQKTGAKVQCTKGKCPRAFHVSCANENAGTSLKVWEVETPIPPVDGEILPEGAAIEFTREIKVELLCPQHNPDMKAQVEQKKADALQARILSMPVGSSIKIRVRGGASVEYSLVEAKASTREVVVMGGLEVQSVYPWSSVDFRSAPVKMVENEYARVHTNLRKASENRSADATPVTDTLQTAGYGKDASTTALPTSTSDTKRKPDRPLSTHAAPLKVHQMLNPSADSIPSRIPLRDAPPPPGNYGQQRFHPPPVTDRSLPPPPAHHLPGHSGPAKPIYAGHAPPRAYLPPIISQAPLYGWSGQQPPPPPGQGYYRSSPAGYAPPPLRATSANGYGSPGQPSHVPHNSNGYPPQQWPPSGPRVTNGKSSQGGAGKIDLGLQRMQALMAALRPLTVPAIHLAGTNGKGSVSAVLESCLMAAGMTTARYNSPHLLEPRDAIRIDGQPPSLHAYQEAMNTVGQINHTNGIGATTFEIATAGAFHLINSVQPPVDVMIIECGMGGARDATNVIPNELKLASALTAVGLDHTTFLGDTVYKIASEKAQIAPVGGVMVIGPQPHREVYEAAGTIAAQARAKIAYASPSQELKREDSRYMQLRPFVPPQPKLVRTPLTSTYLDTEFRLGGAHQLDNLSVAVTVLDIIRQNPRARSIQPKLGALTDKAIQIGVARTEWAGRCSWMVWKDPRDRTDLPVLVDGAHNSDSAATLRTYIDSLPFYRRPKTRFIVSLSASPGKTIDSVLRPLLRPGDEVHLVEFTTPVEGMPWIKPVPLAEAEQVAVGIVGRDNVVYGGRGVEGIEFAFQRVRDLGEERLTVVCGSLYLVADAYRSLMRP